jgi:hypothetical protein
MAYTSRINGQSIVSIAHMAMRAEQAKEAKASKRKGKPEVESPPAKPAKSSIPARRPSGKTPARSDESKAFGKAVLAAIVADPVASKFLPRLKESVVESEPYRRLVAARACASCSREGHSQAAHVPPSGKGIKTDDRETFPLCADGPRAGQKGCHPLFDSWKLVPGGRPGAVKQGKKWAAQTRAAIEAEGSWPKKLPKFKKRGSK